MPQNLTLTQIWNQSTGIYKEGTLVFLKVEQEDMPMSLVNSPIWLAAMERLPDRPGWAVGIHLPYLHKASLADKQAANALMSRAEQIPLYRPVIYIPVEKEGGEGMEPVFMPLVWHDLPSKNSPPPFVQPG